MGTTAGRHYPLGIQAKLPLSSSSKSKGQFKPPKRSRPLEETDGSIDDQQLLSIYDVSKAYTMIRVYSRGHVCPTLGIDSSTKGLVLIRMRSLLPTMLIPDLCPLVSKFLNHSLAPDHFEKVKYCNFVVHVLCAGGWW